MNDFNNLLDIVSQLRKECPWDKEQTHESLAKHLIEESYELLDTLSNLNDSPESFNDFKEELGCLLYTSPSPRDRTRSRMPSSA